MKTLTKTSHIETVRQRNLTTEEQICRMLGIDRNAYCTHQYVCYEKTIALLTNGLPKATKELRYSAVFRGFFNSEWCFRNENDFLPYAKEEFQAYLDIDNGIVYPPIEAGDKELLQEYRFIHLPTRLYHDDDFREKYAMIIDHIISTRR